MKIRSFRYLTVEGLKNVWVNRLMSLASVGVLIACMLLIGVAVVFSLNVEQFLGELQQQNVVMAYFTDGRATADNERSVSEIEQMDNVAKVVYVPKEEGLRSQLEQMGEEYESLFEWLEDDNPLPDGAMITFSDLSKYDATYDAINARPEIHHLNGSQSVARIITAISRTIGMVGIGIIALLMLIALVIIANTIRITMHNRRLEISIMKAVGATNWFIRIPFIVEGMVMGIASGLLTTGGLYVLYRLVIESISRSFPGFLDPIPFRSFYLWLCGIFVAIGLLAGVIGSLLTLSKYLKREGSAFGAIH